MSNQNTVDDPNYSASYFNSWQLYHVSAKLPLNFTTNDIVPAFAYPEWVNSPHVFRARATKTDIIVYAVKVGSYAWHYYWCAIGR